MQIEIFDISQCLVVNHVSNINLNKFSYQFPFQSFSKSEIKKEILDLDNSKAYKESDVPTNSVKSNSYIFAEIL